MSKDYEVGYGRPPKETRFKKGQSGNPCGRSKGTKNLKTDLLEELNESITIREGEKTRTISKQRALLKAMMSKSLKGDAPATANMLRLMAQCLDPTGDTGDEAPLTREEREVIMAYTERLLRDQDDAGGESAEEGAVSDSEGEEPSR